VERDREAAERAAVADAAAAQAAEAAARVARLEEANERSAAERVRMMAELDAAREEVETLRSQVRSPYPWTPPPPPLPCSMQCLYRSGGWIGGVQVWPDMEVLLLSMGCFEPGTRKLFQQRV
jgi:hypothetical protein